MTRSGACVTVEKRGALNLTRRRVIKTWSFMPLFHKLIRLFRVAINDPFFDTPLRSRQTVPERNLGRKLTRLVEMHRRAAAGLIITEDTAVSQQGTGCPNTPGIYSGVIGASASRWSMMRCFSVSVGLARIVRCGRTNVIHCSCMPCADS